MSGTAQLRKRIESFPRWHYEFDLDGIVTPIFDPAHVNRHRQRKAYFFAPLVRLCGGTLAGKKVLDLGCNAGYWSLAAIEAGADFVLGVDGRQMHIDQANLVFEVKGIKRDRYRFEAASVFELDPPDAPFDIVLCLGLLYHVSRPVDLIERISAWNTDILVIDTALDPIRGPYFRLVRQNVNEPRSAVDRDIAFHPSSEAVARLVQQYGYGSVERLKPRFTSWEGATSYQRGNRRAFVCAKHSALDGFNTEPVAAWTRAVPWRRIGRYVRGARARVARWSTRTRAVVKRR